MIPNTPSRLIGPIVAGLLAAFSTHAASDTPSRPPIFNVRDLGALGNGVTLDTASLQAAIDACAASPGSQVRIPPGRYLSGTVHLRSHVTLVLEPGAVLMGTTNLDAYSHPDPRSAPQGFRWGRWYRALLLGVNVENITLCGSGTLDGNQVFDPDGEEHMRGPHTVVLAGCRNVTLRDLNFVDSANYAVFFLATDDVDIRNVKFVGGWDGIHWRGSPDRWCHNVTITDCQFYTGDDALAGSYWDHTLISGCIINSSCNGLRLIGPARNLIVHDCLFFGPGRQPHRTSGSRRRTNMLGGILLQPGAWEPMPGPLDNVLLSDNVMSQVALPVAVWTRPGNTAGSITIAGLDATGVYRSALSLESWSETRLEHVTLRNVSIHYAATPTPPEPEAEVRRPGTEPRPLPAWGLYARNVGRLALEQVSLKLRDQDQRPVILAEQVEELDVDRVVFPRLDGVTRPVLLRQVDTVIHHDAASGQPVSWP